MSSISIVRVSAFLIVLAAFAAAAYSAEGRKAGDAETKTLTGSHGSFELVMVYIPAAAFTMGQEGGSAYPDEGPARRVTLSKDFYMGKYTITQEQYQAVTGENPSHFASDAARGEAQAKRPVENVTWYDAIEFCNTLSKLAGRTPVYTITGRTPALGYPITGADVSANWDANGYRLPTEAEWEYACRAGTTTEFSFGNAVNGGYAWYGNTRGNSDAKTHEVGKKLPNPWGLYDMSGNVWEWCWDWYARDYYENPAAGLDPRGAGQGVNRVIRGGGWYSSAGNLRATFRNCSSPSGRDYVGGFRVVCF